MKPETEHTLGTYLRYRRAGIEPASLGIPAGRRRTPGLRREEVAQMAGISATWYTWLEQGRGGSPSAEVLERLAEVLMLTDGEREHLFLLGLGHPPEARYQVTEGVTPRLQRVLDAYEFSPAIIKTATWDVLAWNRAAAVVLTDYGKLAPDQRNILRLLFGSDRVKDAQSDWKSTARHVVAAFRADVARAGARSEVTDLVDELCRLNAEFKELWQGQEIFTHQGGSKKLRHPSLGWLNLEYSSFIVEGRPDLSMLVYTAAGNEESERLKAFIREAEIRP